MPSLLRALASTLPAGHRQCGTERGPSRPDRHAHGQPTSYAEKYTLVGQPVVPVVIARRTGLAPERTNASTSARRASLG